jgi:hypothetical protein
MVGLAKFTRVTRKRIPIRMGPVWEEVISNNKYAKISNYKCDESGKSAIMLTDPSQCK